VIADLNFRISFPPYDNFFSVHAMESHPLAIALWEIYHAQYKTSDLSRLLLSLDEDLENLNLSGLSAEAIAPIIHSLYVIQNTSIRGVLLRIICEVEAASPSSIVESVHFDYLISESLEQRLPDPQPKVDEEKNSAFRAVYLLLRLRKGLPVSILRALVGLYQQPKHIYKDVIIAIFCEAATVGAKHLADVPEIGQFLIDLLFESGNPSSAALITFSVEEKHAYVRQHHFISRALTPLMRLAGKSDDADPPGATLTAVTSLLQTWPGLLFFGLQCGLLRDLLRSLPHASRSILAILQTLLNISPLPGVLDAFHGVLFHGLLEAGLVPLLRQLSSQNEASAFLQFITPYLTPEPEETTIQLSPASPIGYRLYRLFGSGDARVITAASFTLAGPPDGWDWQGILRLLTVLLPNYPVDVSSAPARAFYSKLLDYFGSLDQESILDGERGDALDALMNLFLEHAGITGELEKNVTFRNAIEKAIVSLITNKKPHRHFFKHFCRLLITPRGCEVIAKWNATQAIQKVGGFCTDVAAVDTFFSYYSRAEIKGIGSIFLESFLSTADDTIFEITIGHLRKMTVTAKNFQSFVYRPVLVPFLKNSFPKEEPRLTLLLNLVYEILLINDGCLAITAADGDLHRVLSSVSRSIYSLLFAKVEAHSVGKVEDELKWWLDQGNRSYVGLFESAVNQFSGPAILGQRVPPHLFGQLARLPEGRSLVFPHVPGLIEKLQGRSDHDRSAAVFALAHFASDKATHRQLAKLALFETMLSVWSLASFSGRGALISALSLVPHSKSFAEVLGARDWQIFKFGRHIAVFPGDLAAADQPEPFIVPPVVEGGSDLANWIKQLSSPIAVKTAQPALARAFAENPDQFASKDLAAFTHRFLAAFVVPSEARGFLIKLFGRVALVDPPKRPNLDEARAAVVRAQLHEFLKGGGAAMGTFSEVKVPTVPAGGIAAAAVCAGAPEVYLSEGDFKAAAKMTKEAFYKLDVDKMAPIRAALVK
jgi:hypothetical protein